MARVRGIPAGGLFNEIFEAHIKGRTTRTEYVSDIRPDELYDPVAAAAAKEQATPMRQITVTRPKYTTIPAAEEEYGPGQRVWNIFLSMLAMIVYILLVARPVSESLPPGTFARVAVSGSAFLVWWGVYVVLKKRWMKKAAQRNPGEVMVLDGTEQVTQWVEDTTAKARNQRAAVDNAYAQRAQARRKVTTTLYPSLRQDKKWVDKDELKDQMRHLKNYMNSTGNIPNWVNKEVAGFERIFGAACEVTTARAVAALNLGDVFNDVVLRNSDGSVSANIDHLLSLGTSAIMLDSKWWSTAPQFVTDRQGRRMVSATGPHERAVSTCVYEASFLPRQPRAIIFCIRGKAAREMGGPQVVDSFNKFVPYEKKPQGVQSTPCPVIFVPSDQLHQVVSAVARGGGMVAGTHIPAAHPAPFNPRELDSLEVTTELTFEG